MKRIYSVLVVLLLLLLFFYKLSDAPLLSYDEAWYAEISRNIVLTKNPLKLIFNDKVFTDHPPVGFIIMSIPTAVLGSNEFSVKFSSTILGLASIILIYQVGRKLEDRLTGLSAGVVLISSMWFMFRARSGNLDVPLVFFTILTVYLLLHKQKKYFYLGVTSLALTLLIKTLVGVGIIPVSLFLIYQNHFKYKKISYFKALIIFLVVTLPWYIYNQQLDYNFLHHHFFDIGIRGQENGYSLTAIKNNLFYLSIGIGKWYKIFLTSIVLLFLGFIKNKQYRAKIALIFFWFLGFSIFLVSSKTEVWHLIPIYPPIALAIALIPKMLSSLIKIKTKLIKLGFTGFVVLLGIYQYHQFSNLIYTNLNGYSDEKDISIKAGKYQSIYLLDTFMPASIYYSKKHVTSLHWDKKSYQNLVNLLEKQNDSVFIVNNKLIQQLQTDKVNFKVLEQNSSYLVISNPNQGNK